MSAVGYANGVALWNAVTAKAKSLAKETGREPAAILRQFVFSRFLARVFNDGDGPWVLKGGTAMLARVNDARTTKDVDLLNELGDIDAAVAALSAAAGVDLGDHFRFTVRKVDRATAGGGSQPGVMGCRIGIDAYVGAVRRQSFGVDLVTGSLMTARPDLQHEDVMGVKGLKTPVLRLSPVVDHVADKLCAIQATYGAAGDRSSSRVKDLVDLVVFARTQTVSSGPLTRAVLGEWAHRGLVGKPKFEPPASWVEVYPPAARRTAPCNGFETLGTAKTLIDKFLAPVLEGWSQDYEWSADDAAWHRL